MSKKTYRDSTNAKVNIKQKIKNVKRSLVLSYHG